MTYSIVARDALTGALGVGVQTHQPAVGAIVPWVKAGVGAVATQSFANINFGPQGLSLLEHGLNAPRTLAALVAGDDLPGRRQVAVIDGDGAVAVHTGDECIPFASHVVGEGFSAQANMMTSEGVPEAMAEAFRSAAGVLAVRIMAALDAGQRKGGDIRGRQSAAILVRAPRPLDYRWDLRVDNSADPLGELRRLVDLRVAGALLEEVGGSTPYEEAMAAYHEASRVYPSDEQTFWFALSGLTAMGRADEAAALLGPVFERGPQWRELLRRLDLPGAAELREAVGVGS
ncbi:MAG: DUF1028 domain-containing protein [Dehalococcoidia bacterium]|nr:DUF1028 domain-containing protein [Dehalococcoidia bacterium]